MRGVVIDGTDDHAARPGGNARERGSLQSALLVACLHVLHLTGATGSNPIGKMLVFGGIGDGSDSAHIKTRGLGGLLNCGLDVADPTSHGTSSGAEPDLTNYTPNFFTSSL